MKVQIKKIISHPVHNLLESQTAKEILTAPKQANIFLKPLSEKILFSFVSLLVTVTTASAFLLYGYSTPLAKHQQHQNPPGVSQVISYNIPKYYTPNQPKTANLLALMRRNTAAANNFPEVLGLSTSVAGVKGSSPITQSYIQQLITQTLNQYLAEGKFKGPKGDQGDAGNPGTGLVQNDNGKSTAVVGNNPIVTYIPSNPSIGYQGGSLAGFTTLSSNSFSGNNVTANNITANGSFTANGNLNVTGSVNLATTTVDSLTVGRGIFAGTPGHSSSTVISTVDSSSPNVGLLPSLAIGPDGFGRIAYYDETNRALKYAQCTNADCSTSNITTLDSSGNAEPFFSLAVAPDGFGRIAYSNDGALDFIQCLNASCSLGKSTIVDSTVNVAVEGPVAVSIDVGKNGFAQIAYFDSNTSNIKFVQCTTADCASSQTSVVAAGVFPAIKIGPDGFARIVYTQSSSSNLQFAQCTNESCAGPVIKTVDANGAEFIPSLAIGSDGFAGITYLDENSGSIKFARCTDAACTSPAVTSIGGTDTGSSSIVFGPDGFARISYINENDEVSFVQCTSSACANSSGQIVDSSSSFGSLSLGIASDGFAQIAYTDSINHKLKYAHLQTADSTTKVTGTVLGSATAPFGNIFTSGLNSSGNVSFTTPTTQLGANAIDDGDFTSNPTASTNFIKDGDFSTDPSNAIGSNQIANGDFTDNPTSDFGSEQVANGNFSEGSTDWETESDTWDFSGNQATFVAPTSGPITFVLVANGGSGYEAGDVVNVDGGDGTATLTIDTVNGSGTVTALEVTTGGTNYTLSTEPTTGGHGHGLTVSIASIYDFESVALLQPLSLTNGAPYRMQFDVSGTNGEMLACFGTLAPPQCFSFPAGSGLVSFIAPGTTGFGGGPIFLPSFDFNGSISNVSVKPIADWSFGYGNSGWTWDSASHKADYSYPNSGALNDVSIANGGRGYNVGDEVVVNGGTLGLLSVTSVDGSGAVTGIAPGFFNGDQYQPGPEGTMNFVGDPGSGLVVSIDSVTPDDPQPLFQPGSLIAGPTYQAQFDVGGTTGTVVACFDQGTCQTFSAGAGTVSFNGTWASGNEDIIDFTPSTDFNGSITNVSVKPFLPTWTLGSGWSWDSSKQEVTHDGSGSFTSTLAQPGVLQPNNVYTVNLNLTGSSGDVNVCLDGGTCDDFNAGSGAVSFSGTWANSAGDIITITPSSDFDGSVSNVSVTSPPWYLGLGWAWDSTGHTAQIVPITIGGLNSVSVVSGGSGYIDGDIVNVDGGNSAGQILVDSVDGSGTVTSLEVNSPGNQYTTGQEGTTGGTGSGLIVSVDSINPESPGQLIQVGALKTGITYQVSFDIGGSAGDVTAQLGSGTSQDFNAGSGSVSFTGTWAPSMGPGGIIFEPSSDFNGTISNVSVLEIPPGGSRLISVSAPISTTTTNGTNLVVQAGPSVSGGVAGLFQIADPTSGNKAGFDISQLTQDRIYKLPDASGTLVTTVTANDIEGDCATWSTSTPGVLVDAGAPCGSGGGGGSIEDGNGNIITGYHALADNTSGYSNIALGDLTLSLNTTGAQNIALGANTLSSNITGSQNVALGYQAGASSLGSGNIFLGYNAGANETGSNKLYIGTLNGDANTPIIYGDLTTGDVGIGTKTPTTTLVVDNPNLSEAVVINASGTSNVGTGALYVNQNGYDSTIDAVHYDNAGNVRNADIWSLNTQNTTSLLSPSGGGTYLYGGGNFVVTQNGTPTIPTSVFGVRAVATANNANFTTYGGYFSANSSAGTAYGVYSAAGTNYFNGNVGINNTTPHANLDLVGMERITSSDTPQSYSEQYTYRRTLAQAVGSYTDIAKFNTNNGSFNMEVDLTDGTSGGSTSKKYLVVGSYDDSAAQLTPNGWLEVLPLTSSGPRSGDYTLDFGDSSVTSGAIITLRLRTTATLAQPTAAVDISIKTLETPLVQALYDSGTGATVSGYFRNSTLTQYAGKVGIGTNQPTSALQVANGNISVTQGTTPTVLGTLSQTFSVGEEPGIAVSGQFAYITSGQGNSLNVVDISDPNNPNLVGTLQDNLNLNTDLGIAVSGKYAYVGGSGNAIAVVDVSNPSSPKVVGSVIDARIHPLNLYSLAVSGKYVYVINDGPDSFIAIDVSNPAAPKIASTISDATYLVSPRSLYVSGKYAYVMAGSSGNNRLTILDISNPTAPVIVGSLHDDTNLDTSDNNGPIVVSGRYAYVGTQTDNGVNKRLTIVDVSNPASPTIAGSLNDPSGNLTDIQSIQISGRYAYLRVGRSGGNNRLAIADISSSTDPTLLSSTLDNTNFVYGELVVSGKYGYMISPSRLAVVDLSGLNVPLGNIGNIFSQNLTVSENANIGSLSLQNGLNVGLNGILTAGPLSVSATSSPSYFGDNVGIGTTTPLAALSVVGSTSVQGNVRINGVGNGLYFPDGTFMGTAAATGTGISSPTDLSFAADNDSNGSGQMTFATHGATRMSITNAGNIGIGTTSPIALLSLAGGTTAANGINLGDTNSNLYRSGVQNIKTDASFTVGGNLNVSNITDSPGDAWINISGVGMHLGGNGSQTGLNISSAVGNYVGINTTTPTAQLQLQGIATSSVVAIFDITSSSGASELRVNSNGNVGIGTTNPNALLEVNGFIRSDSGGIINASGNTTIQTQGSGSAILAAGNNQLVVTSNSGSPANVIYTTTANVGIGTSTPAYSLDVNGTLRVATTSTTGVLFGSTISGVGGISIGGMHLESGGDSGDLGFDTTPVFSFCGSALCAVNFSEDGGVGLEFNPRNDGKTVLDLQENGNVGINTTTPTAELMVQGVATSSVIQEFSVASSSGSSYFTITSFGNVGIGTSTPGHLITLSGGAFSDGSTWSNASDQNLKENFASVSPTDILQKISALPISEWNYKTDSATTTHMGPTAQDFYAAFHLGGPSGQTSISTVDEPAIALLGVQALEQQIVALQGALSGNATSTDLAVYNPSNFSGDSVGEAEILGGADSVRVAFSQTYSYQPVVVISLLGDPTPIFSSVSEVDANGFTISLNQNAPYNLTFNWHSFASPNAKLTVSDGSTSAIQLIIASTTPPTTLVVTPPVGQILGTSTSTPSDDSVGTTTPDTTSSTPSDIISSTTPPSADGSTQASSTPEATPTPTPSPTVSPTPSPSPTASPTPTDTPTPTPTDTPTPVPTINPTPTDVPSPTPTTTASPTQ